MLHIIWQLWFLSWLVYVKLEHSQKYYDFYFLCLSYFRKKLSIKILHTKYDQCSHCLGQYWKFIAVWKFHHFKYTLCDWNNIKLLDDWNVVFQKRKKNCCEIYMDTCCFIDCFNLLPLFAKFMESAFPIDRIMYF